MRISWKKVIFVLFVTVLSYLLALIWWRVWMYQGFWGPVPILHWLVPIDGESSYFLTELEMFIDLIFLLSAGCFVYSLVVKK